MPERVDRELRVPRAHVVVDELLDDEIVGRREVVRREQMKPPEPPLAALAVKLGRGPEVIVAQARAPPRVRRAGHRARKRLVLERAERERAAAHADRRLERERARRCRGLVGQALARATRRRLERALSEQHDDYRRRGARAERELAHYGQGTRKEGRKSYLKLLV